MEIVNIVNNVADKKKGWNERRMGEEKAERREKKEEKANEERKYEVKALRRRCPLIK